MDGGGIDLVTARELLGQVLVVLGGLLFVSAGVALLRLQDAFARLGAVAKAAGLGISLILVGVFCFEPSAANAVKLLAAVTLQLMTSAVGSLVIARAAYVTGSPMHRQDEGHDELGPAVDRSEGSGA